MNQICHNCGKYEQNLKQKMSLKPMRSGYKACCLSLEGGYLYNFEIYKGRDQRMSSAASLV